jgi:hypothetical protein
MAPTGTTPLPQAEHLFHYKVSQQTVLLLQAAVEVVTTEVAVVVLVVF